jgi:hypothetical protein
MQVRIEYSPINQNTTRELNSIMSATQINMQHPLLGPHGRVLIPEQFHNIIDLITTIQTKFISHPTPIVSQP